MFENWDIIRFLGKYLIMKKKVMKMAVFYKIYQFLLGKPCISHLKLNKLKSAVFKKHDNVENIF